MKQKKYLILGLAKSGIASFNLIYNKKDYFYLFDEDKNVRNQIIDKTTNLSNVFVVSTLDNILIDFIDTIIISPSISIYMPIIKYAKRKGKEIISELELAFRYCKNKIVAITGTNGKTTTVNLTYEIFKEAGFSVEKVGNIGIPLSERVKKVNRKTVFICEVSSFQLEAINKFKPKFAGILNITPDHINRHKTFNCYKNTKYKIFKNLKNTKIVVNNNLNYRNKKFKIYKFGQKNVKNGCFVDNNYFYFAKKGKKEKICSIFETNLLGKHNLENIMASICFAKFFKIKNKFIVKALNNFKSSSHRIEKVYEKDDICFYDDSKATNIDSCIKATKSLTKDTILILGGSDKGYDYDEIFINLPKNIIKVYACGEVAKKIIKAGNRNKCEVVSFKTLKDATFKACNEIRQGQNVLLSPASASFDEFSSYKERGKKFLSYIKEYYEKNQKT